MPNTINLNFFFFNNKILKWFGDCNLGVFPSGFRFNPWWMCALTCFVNIVFINFYIMANGVKTFLLTKSKKTPATQYFVIIFEWFSEFFTFLELLTFLDELNNPHWTYWNYYSNVTYYTYTIYWNTHNKLMFHIYTWMGC